MFFNSFSFFQNFSVFENAGSLCDKGFEGCFFQFFSNFQNFSVDRKKLFLKKKIDEKIEKMKIMKNKTPPAFIYKGFQHFQNFFKKRKFSIKNEKLIICMNIIKEFMSWYKDKKRKEKGKRLILNSPLSEEFVKDLVHIVDENPQTQIVIQPKDGGEIIIKSRLTTDTELFLDDLYAMPKVDNTVTIANSVRRSK